LSSPKPPLARRVAQWLPLSQRVNATVYLTLALALLFGAGVVAMTRVMQLETDDLVELANASKAVRGFRTNVDAMQFAAHRFVASNHTSAVDQVRRLYTDTRVSLTSCLALQCAGISAQARIEQLREHLDRFYEAFSEAVNQRNLMKTVIDNRFKPRISVVRSRLGAIQGGVEDDADAVKLRTIERHSQRLEEAANALLYAANLQSFSSLAADFESERDRLARLPASTPAAPVAAIQAALSDIENTWAVLLQRARGYLFLVNVVMAADAHEMQVIADRLEQKIDGAMVDVHARNDLDRKRFTLVLILLLVAGSLSVFAVGRIMTTSVTTQLRVLTRTFNDLAAGSQAPIQIQGLRNDEIGELGTAAVRFRDANAEISDLLRRYQALNEELESKVAERTQALEDSNRELERLANTDRLTGVLNRRALEQLIADEIERSQRYSRPLSLLFLDLDHFKAINDRYGHDLGDAVLMRLAREVRSMLRANDWLGRWGGEEFLILCSETNGEDARHLAERIRRHIAGLNLERVGQVSLSIGISSFAPGQTLESLVAEADRAMYRAKALGRNRCVLAP
jgi:diguanylate cyclase (GGDEF)-like protein